MTTERAQSDTTKECGYPNARDGKPCQKKISTNAESCARHSEAADEWRRQVKADFLEQFTGAHGQVQVVAARLGVARETLYAWREADDEFRQVWNVKRARCAANYEETMADRFFDGWLEPVFHQGKIVGHVRKWENKFGPFMLKALDPKYSDRTDVNLTVSRKPSEQTVRELAADPAAFAQLVDKLGEIEQVTAERVDTGEEGDDV